MTELRDLNLGAGKLVPATALDVRFARSGGPGGQHVNKTETKVDLRCDLELVESSLGPTIIKRLRTALVNRLDADGKVQVVCGEGRSRHRNLQTALDRMEELLTAAAIPPKKRVATKPTGGSKQRRLTDKKRRGEVKKQRQVDPD